MKKSIILTMLNTQKDLTKKSTRKDIIDVVASLVDYHIKDNAEVEGLSLNRSSTGLNLGELVEVVIRSIFRNKVAKSNLHGCDATYKGEKVEVKFSTSDAYAHPINPQAKVDYYLLATYSKANGGIVFKVPYAKRSDIVVNAQSRVMCNQLAKYIDQTLTEKVFGVVGL